MLSAVEGHKSPALALKHDLYRTMQAPNGRRTHIVVDSFIDQVNFGGELCRVQVNRGGPWQRHAVEHAHDVAALIAHEPLRALVDQQRRCAAAPVVGAGCVVHLPACMRGMRCGICMVN